MGAFSPATCTQTSKRCTAPGDRSGRAGPATAGCSRAAPSSVPFPAAQHGNQPVPTHLMCSVISPACLPQQHVSCSSEAISQVKGAHLLGSPLLKYQQPVLAAFQINFLSHLSPPAFETLGNDSLADTIVSPFLLFLKTYSCPPVEQYWMAEQRAGDCGKYSEYQAVNLRLSSGATLHYCSIFHHS